MLSDDCCDRPSDPDDQLCDCRCHVAAHAQRSRQQDQDAADNRRAFIQVRLTTAELAEIRRRADKAGRTMSAHVRYLVLESPSSYE